MLKVERFVNELMASNCYVVYDDDTKRCLVIDPGSKESLREIAFIDDNNLKLDYIIITHEHTDHTWGVNSIKERYPDSKILCSENCDKYAPKASRVYFLYYYDDPNYHYVMDKADFLIKRNNEEIEWNGYNIHFLLTPGHSYGSMCVKIKCYLFTGDTMMPYPPYFNGRDSNEEDWKASIVSIKQLYNDKVYVMPGHGDRSCLKDIINYYHRNGNL